MNVWQNLRVWIAMTAFGAISGSSFGATEVDLKEYFRQIGTLVTKEQYADAHAMVDRAIAQDPRNSQLFYARGQVFQASGEHRKAVTAFTEVIKLDPNAVQAYQQRGVENFRIGQINESITDWEKVIKMKPEQEPYHWQRGISYYYAGRYTDGRKQFELHQTVNPSDVENAVWHFLCVTRESGLAKARSSLIPISGDSRIPMMEVHALFEGKLKPEDVLAAAKKGNPGAAELKHRQFYANLYLGLYSEATGDNAAARDYILKAAAMADPGDYMGDVARVHAWIIGKKREPK